LSLKKYLYHQNNTSVRSSKKDIYIIKI